MQKKEQKQVENRRIIQDIEEAKPYLDDYEEWGEETSKADKSEYLKSDQNKGSEMTVEIDKKSGRDISFYKVFDRFQAEHDVSENNEEIFYENVFQKFNEQ